uniref:Uncharacterized protein n=1 Tax=Ascaris lumbricoides TaxID=6252 RepID=A0A0M3INV1_ASCLU
MSCCKQKTQRQRYTMSGRNTIFMDAGMNLRSFTSSNEEVNDVIHLESREEAKQTKAFGITWSLKEDKIALLGVNAKNGAVKNKQQIFTFVASHFFDPLGLMAPVFVPVKVFLQQLWKKKYKCDDSLEAEENKCVSKPGDIATRGVAPDKCKENFLSWHGPLWLRHSAENWPKWELSNPQQCIIKEDIFQKSTMKTDLGKQPAAKVKPGNGNQRMIPRNQLYPLEIDSDEVQI